ncbi:MAG: ribosome small subunit-dependent GTPase A [Phycisphaerae bacterium]
MMTRDRKKRTPGTRKVRVRFRPNRSDPAREKGWSRFAPGGEDADSDPQSEERVVAKGPLSRKRTVIVHDDHAGDTSNGRRLGTVVTLFGRIAHVDDGKRVWQCTVRRVLRTRSIRDRNPVTVGDHVQFTVSADREGVEAEGVIEAVEPRRGELKRLVRRREQTVAANVDQAVIVTSAAEPDPRPHLVDRYIVSALHGCIEPVVCLNKTDLTAAKEVDRFLSVYRDLGYKTLATSAVHGGGIDALRALLQDKKSVIAGQSGVGKSTILNAVQPGLKLKTGPVVAETLKGRHVTSRATLLKLDVGGYVVDTPGVRSFDLRCIPREYMERYFVEFVEPVRDCKFPDCTHIHEDQCAVKTAVEQGRIHPQRYESYIRLFTDADCRRSAPE